MQKSISKKEYKVFREELRNMRERAGITQMELAELLECTQTFVSKCERGERRVDVIELRAWCEALGTPFPTFARELEGSLAGIRRRR
jgi:transcriptional regulator with XRE-family HTH domain